MALHNEPKRRYHVAENLTGNELIPFETGGEPENRISARDLKHYVGGDLSAPSIRPERGAHSTAISEFPNAEFNLQPGDIVTGLHDGLNVNFSFDQIVAGVLAAIAQKTVK